MLTQIYKELDGDDAATKFLDSKRYAIIGHLPLSIQLVESYVNSGKLFAAREFLGLLREEHAENTYINYINGLVDKARGLNASALEFVNRIPEQEQQQFDILLLKAELLIELDKFSDANTILQELNNQNPENLKVVNLRGSLALKMNDFALSEQLFKQILTQQNDNYLAKYNLAISMVKQNKINQAIHQLKQTDTLNEDHAPSRVMLSKYLFLRGDVDEAQQHAEYLSRRDESYVQGHELLSRIYMKKLQWLDAFNSTSTLLQDDNLNPSYLADHIRVLNGLDRRQETTRYLSILGSLWGDSWQNLIQLAQLHELVAQKDKAAEVLEKAIELKPNSSRPYLYLTQVYIALSQHSKANSVLKNTEKLFGRSDVSVTLKGDIANAENKTKTALKFYNQALKLNPASDIALVKLYQLAKSNVGANKFSQLMLKRLKSDTSKPWHRKLLADHYLNHGQNDKAIREYQTLLAIPGLDKDISILNNLANLHVPNQLEMALDYAFRAYQIDNKNPVILDTYGWVLVQLDKKQEALAVLRNAASMDALNPEINYHLGVLLAQMGRVDDAKFELNKALETKTFPYRKEVQALLETL